VQGYDADVICVAGDPSTDISLLGNPDNVTHVWRGGVRYKG
jgi:imidazolonepropionase-like amidohydrolase